MTQSPVHDPGRGWQQQPPPQPPPPHQGRRATRTRPPRRRGPLVLLLLVVLVLAVGGTAVALRAVAGRGGGAGGAARSGGAGGQRAFTVTPVPTELPGWREGTPISDEALAAVQPEKFFWTVFKRVALLRVQELIQEPWVAPIGKPLASNHPPSIYTYRMVFDYATKQLAKASTGRFDGRLDSASICAGGRLYSKTKTDLEEGNPYTPYPDETTSVSECPLVLNEQAYKNNGIIAVWLNDAFMTGGLTGEQADRFIALMRERELVTVAKVWTVSAAGKRYIAVKGTVNRVVNTSINARSRLGTVAVRGAFVESTGLEDKRHPYPFTVGGLQGLKWVYYLDPATLRPAFSKVETTPVLTVDGAVSPENARYNESVSWIRWRYPKAVPKLSLRDGQQPLSVDWPKGLPGR